eukprot:17821-Heterococcus_DN1.PRE.3
MVCDAAWLLTKVDGPVCQQTHQSRKSCIRVNMTARKSNHTHRSMHTQSSCTICAQQTSLDKRTLECGTLVSFAMAAWIRWHTGQAVEFMHNGLSADVCMQTEAYICTRNLKPAGTNGVALCVYQLDRLVYAAIITKELVVLSTTLTMTEYSATHPSIQWVCFGSMVLYSQWRTKGSDSVNIIRYNPTLWAHCMM